MSKIAKKRTLFWLIITTMSFALVVWLTIAYNAKKDQYIMIDEENARIKAEMQLLQTKIDSLTTAIALQDAVIRHSIIEYDSLNNEKELVMKRMKEAQEVLRVYPVTAAVDTLRRNLSMESYNIVKH